MKSLVKVLMATFVLTAIAWGQTAVTVVPNQLPKGAFVQDGGDGDHQYSQAITITLNTSAWGGVNGGTDVVITLPSGTRITDPDGDGDLVNGIYVLENLTGVTIAAGDVTVTGTNVINLGFTGTPGAAAEPLTVIFPVETDDTPISPATYTISFSDPVETQLTPSITYEDTLGIFTFNTAFAGVDSTDEKGKVYPTALQALATANLPDLIVDITGWTFTIQALNDQWFGAQQYTAYNDGTDDNGEAIYYLWFSQTPSMQTINTDVAQRVDDTTDPPLNVHSYEAVAFVNPVAGANWEIDAAELPEGWGYFYVTTSATADWAVATSDSVRIKHWPVFATGNDGAGWDYDQDGDWQPGSGADNTQTLTLESGGTIGKDAVIGSANTDSMRFFYSVEDVDDSATIQIFISSLVQTVDSITVSGPTGSEIVTGLGAAREITPSLLDEHTTRPYFAYYINPAGGSIEPAGIFSVYMVANDGKNQTMRQVTAGAGVVTLTVSHYPFITLEDYYGKDINVDTGVEEYVVISWAGTSQGVDGDKDADATPGNPATIKIYASNIITAWAAAGGTTDPATVNATDQLAASVASNPNETFLIATMSDLGDDPSDNRVVWGVREANLDITPAAYYFYAHINHGTDDLIVQLNDAEDITGGGTPRTVTFSHSNYFLSLNPVESDQVLLNADDTYTLEWSSFNALPGGTEEVHILMVPAGTDVNQLTEVQAPNTQDFNGLVGADGAAGNDGWYWLTSTIVSGGELPNDPVSATAGKLQIDVADYTIDTQGTVDDPSTNPAATAVNYKYDVYYIYSSDVGGFNLEPYVKADGQLQFSSQLTVAASDNFSLTPTKAVLEIGDTITVTIKFKDPGDNAQFLHYYLDIPKTYFRILDQDGAADGVQPILDESANLSGNTLTNTLDSTATHYQVDYVEYKAGAGDDISSLSAVGSMTLVVKASHTEPALVDNIITFASEEPRATHMVGPTDLFVVLQTPTVPNNYQISGRGSIKGIVDLELLTADGQDVSVSLMKVGSLVPETDATFVAGNSDSNGDATDGFQLTLGVGGSFTLSEVPTGKWDVMITKQGWLTRILSNVTVQPMSDTPIEFVAFEKMYGGDAAGHTDANGDVVPDNQVDATDVTAVGSAYLSETGDANYNVFADFDGDGSIGLIEFALASKNSGISIDLDHEGVALGNGLGEGQILARAIAVNNEKVIAWLSVESEHGGEYTYTIRAEAVASLRAYAVALRLNSDEWELVSWSDRLFDSNGTERFQKTSGYDHIFVGAMRGLGAVVQKDVELMSFTLQQKVENASRPTLTSVGMVDNSVNFSQAIIGEVDLGLPMEFSLAQNFPNPFNPETTISFSLPQAGRVKLAVYNLLGREVRSLVANTMEAGSYKLVWNSLDNNGRTVSSGLYFYRLVVDSKIIATKKMILLR